MNLEKPQQHTVIPNNPYQAPTAETLPPPLLVQNAPFYIVSKRKFFALFILTFSVYALYWFWENWSRWRDSTGEKVWPVARALFAIFFIHSLFDKMHTAATANSGQNLSKLTIPATLYIIGEIAFNGMDNFEMIGVVYLVVTVVMIGIIAWSIWQAQHQANIATGDIEGLSNDKFTAANYVWMVLGFFFWLLIIFGALQSAMTIY